MNTLTKITFSLFKLPRQKVEEVFTPATAANANYIERAEIKHKNICKIHSILIRDVANNKSSNLTLKIDLNE